MSVVHQRVPWMVRSRARADHLYPAPPPSLKGAGRPNQKRRLRRGPYHIQLCTVVAVVPKVGDRRGSDGPCQAKMSAVPVA
eukprot:5025833-Pyramimonas_sp.AAC.1